MQNSSMHTTQNSISPVANGAGMPGSIASLPSAASRSALYPSVLIIEDSPTVRTLVGQHLSRQGFEVRGFGDGVEALRWLSSEQARLPVVILLDVELPTLDGYEVMRRLREQPTYASIPIVLLSERGSEADRQRALHTGAQQYITKPFSLQDLLAAIMDCLQKARG